jgi:diguanylate cyclase (GGDEF)-like protein
LSASSENPLQPILDVGAALAAHLSLDGALAAVAEKIGELLQATSISVWTYTRDVEPAKRLALWTSDTAAAEDAGTGSGAPDELVREALDGRCVAQTDAKGGRSRLVVPLIIEDEATGYIDVSDDSSGRLDGDAVRAVQIIANQAALAVEIARLREAASHHGATDAVSGLYNRWYFYERLYSETKRAERYRQPLSLIMAELDGFVEFAQERGQTAGGQLLRAVGRLLDVNLRRKVDVACRHDAGTFAILLPNTPCRKLGALLVAERMRGAIEVTEFRNEDNDMLGRFTLSIGVAGYPGHVEDADELAEAAAKALKTAAGGKNKVVVYSSS